MEKLLLQAENNPIKVQYLISRMTNGNFWDQTHYDDEEPVKPTLSSKPARQVVELQDYNTSPSHFNFVTLISRVRPPLWLSENVNVAETYKYNLSVSISVQISYQLYWMNERTSKIILLRDNGKIIILCVSELVYGHGSDQRSALI